MCALGLMPASTYTHTHIPQTHSVTRCLCFRMRRCSDSKNKRTHKGVRNEVESECTCSPCLKGREGLCGQENGMETSCLHLFEDL